MRAHSLLNFDQVHGLIVAFVNIQPSCLHNLHATLAPQLHLLDPRLDRLAFIQQSVRAVVAEVYIELHLFHMRFNKRDQLFEPLLHTHKLLGRLGNVEHPPRVILPFYNYFLTVYRLAD